MKTCSIRIGINGDRKVRWKGTQSLHTEDDYDVIMTLENPFTVKCRCINSCDRNTGVSQSKTSGNLLHCQS